LPAKVSQQILMILDKNWKSFFEAVKGYKTDSSKFTRSSQTTKIQR
jgi:putative transposase